MGIVAKAAIAEPEHAGREQQAIHSGTRDLDRDTWVEQIFGLSDHVKCAQANKQGPQTGQAHSHFTPWDGQRISPSAAVMVEGVR